MKFSNVSVTAVLLLGVPSVISWAFSNTLSSYEVVFSWRTVDYQFPAPSQETRDKLLQSGQFLPENNVVAGIKIHGSKIYLTVPRLRKGVPSTLNYINLNSLSANRSPLLIPYPSWKMQQVGNCNAVQFAQSMEIDRWGRMWVIDVGRKDTLGRSSTSICPAKLLIIDLATDKILHRHVFSADVINPRTNFLNDIVVECTTDEWQCWAYMTDSADAKVILYSLGEDRSWFVQHPGSMEADPEASIIPILGTPYNFSIPVNGIALSPRTIANHDRLYYSPLASYSLYSVATSTLKIAFSLGHSSLKDTDITQHVKHRPTQSGGILMDSTGRLFTGQLQNNAVSYFNTTAFRRDKTFPPERVLIQDDVDLQWPDSFALDSHGYLYVVSSRIHRLFFRTLDMNDVNFRIIRLFVGARSYMY